MEWPRERGNISSAMQRGNPTPVLFFQLGPEQSSVGGGAAVAAAADQLSSLEQGS